MRSIPLGRAWSIHVTSQLCPSPCTRSSGGSRADPAVIARTIGSGPDAQGGDLVQIKLTSPVAEALRPTPEDALVAGRSAVRSSISPSSASPSAKPADQVVQGTFSFPTRTGATYVGQSSNIPARPSAHRASGKLAAGVQPEVTEMSGSRVAREIAEHRAIQSLTGGIPTRFSDKVANMRDPIGPKRSHLLD